MLELAKIDKDSYVLEPSAGEGAIVLELLKLKPAAITAVEIDADKASKLAKMVRGEQVTVYPQDFLKVGLKFGDFERVVMHPPQTNGQDTEHVLRALNLLASGGILVALMQPNDRRTAMRQALQQGYSEVIELQEKDKVLVRIQKP
jgi:16S rRNA G1207 methylase RsmC